MPKKTVGLVLTLLLLLAVIGGNYAQVKESQAEEEATAVRPGELTERQKKHSKLYERYTTGHRLDVPAGGDGAEVYVDPPTQVLSGEPSVNGFAEFLARAGCAADLVVVARVTGKSSQLTEDRSFIFTDYEVSAEEVLKADPRAPVAPQAGLVVTRPGGAVRLNGRVAKATDASYQKLEVGRQYLLFLKQVESTGAYETLRMGSFLKAGDQLTKLTEEAVPGADSPRSFAEVIPALQAGCP